LALISQPADGAGDLGQSLPTGLLTGIACDASTDGGGAAEEGRSARCAIHWRSVGGEPRLTRYAVHLFAGGCVSAGADPALPALRDRTIAGVSENPLNVLLGASQACS
jgi:hypothetical protein